MFHLYVKGPHVSGSGVWSVCLTQYEGTSSSGPFEDRHSLLQPRHPNHTSLPSSHSLPGTPETSSGGRARLTPGVPGRTGCSSVVSFGSGRTSDTTGAGEGRTRSSDGETDLTRGFIRVVGRSTEVPRGGKEKEEKKSSSERGRVKQCVRLHITALESPLCVEWIPSQP